MSHVIAEPCRGCKDAACVETCPVDCIQTTPESPQYFINPDDCIDCAMCASVCPVEAIFIEEDLPGKWSHYLEINRDFFSQ